MNVGKMSDRVSESPLRMRAPCSGFTLVELLVVIAIVSVLLALVVPGLSRARRAATGVSCRTNLRQIGVAMVGYAGDHGSLLPFHGEPADFGWPPSDQITSTGRFSRGTQWEIQIMPYLGIEWPWGRDTPPAALGSRPTIFYCPGGLPYDLDPRNEKKYVRSLSYNYNRPLGEDRNNSRSLDMLQDPSKTFLVLDAHVISSQTGYRCLAATHLGRQHAGRGAVRETRDPGRFCYCRHDGSTHVLFAALQVETRPPSVGLFGIPAGVRFVNRGTLYPWPE